MSCPDMDRSQAGPRAEGLQPTPPPPRCQPPAALPRPCDKRPPRSHALPARRLQEGHRQPIYCGAFNHFAHQLGNLLATVGGNRVRRLAAACAGWAGRQYLRAAL